MTFAVLAEEVKAVTQRPLNIWNVSKAEFTEAMKRTDISDHGLMFATVWQAYALNGNNGEAELTVDVFEGVIGHKLMTAADMLK